LILQAESQKGRKEEWSLTTMIVGVTAAISTAAFLTLWFWVVHRELIAKKETVKSARSQLAACRKNHLRARDGPDEVGAQGILTRSRDIYRQSVTLYNQTLHKPWNCIPGFLMGFREISKEDDG
jgi:hypothetical protein